MGAGSQLHLVTPLFIAMGGLILAIPLICIIVNYLHHRKERARNLSSNTDIQYHASPRTHFKTSWHRLWHGHSREHSPKDTEKRRSEHLEMARLRLSQQYGGDSTKTGDELGVSEPEKAKVRFTSSVKTHSNSFSQRISNLNPFSVRLPHPQPQRQQQQPSAEHLSVDIEAFAADASADSRSKTHAEKTSAAELGRSVSQKTCSSTATTIVSPRTRAASIETARNGPLATIGRGEDGVFRAPPAPVTTSGQHLGIARNVSVKSTDTSSGRTLTEKYNLKRERSKRERERALRMLTGAQEGGQQGQGRGHGVAEGEFVDVDLGLGVE